MRGAYSNTLQLRSARSLTCDLLGKLSHNRKAVGPLGHADSATCVQQVEGVGQLEHVVVGGDGQALGQHAAGLEGGQPDRGDGQSEKCECSEVELGWVKHE